MMDCIVQMHILMAISIPIGVAIVAAYVWREYPPDTYTDLAYPLFQPKAETPLMIEYKPMLAMPVLALERRPERRLLNLAVMETVK